MSERSGIEIDYCPECRGVWLDRGELDKILDRASAETSVPPPAPPQQQQYAQAPQQQYAQPQHAPQQGQYQQPYRRKKKEHWLSEIFD